MGWLQSELFVLMFLCLQSWGQGVISVTCVFCASAGFASCSILETKSLEHAYISVKYVSVCTRANVCALHPLCSQRFLFNSIQTVRAVERLESAGRQQSFGTSAIWGPWKYTHSLVQLAPKEVPAWQISTQNVSRWFSTHTMSPCKFACILWKELAHCFEWRGPGKLTHLLSLLRFNACYTISSFPLGTGVGQEAGDWRLHART